jgi:hypothetical protein
MPHVIVEGPVSVERFYQEFTPTSLREGETIIKIRDVYLSAGKRKALIDCIVVEDRLAHPFYAAMSQKDAGITVYLDPLTDPEKTDGVKRVVAILGHSLKSQNSAFRYGKHNLTGFLIVD